MKDSKHVADSKLPRQKKEKIIRRTFMLPFPSTHFD